MVTKSTKVEMNDANQIYKNGANERKEQWVWDQGSKVHKIN